MRDTFTILMLLTFFVSLSVAGEPSKSKDVNSEAAATNVVTDPVSGEKMYADQLMLAFKEDVTDQIKDRIFAEYGLEPISRYPSLNIYHVTFANPRGRLSKLQKTQEKLQHNPKV